MIIGKIKQNQVLYESIWNSKFHLKTHLNGRCSKPLYQFYGLAIYETKQTRKYTTLILKDLP